MSWKKATKVKPNNKKNLGSIRVLVKSSNFVSFFLVHASQKVGTLQSLPPLPHLLAPQLTLDQHTSDIVPTKTSRDIHRSPLSSCVPELLPVPSSVLTSFSLTYFPPGSLASSLPGSPGLYPGTPFFISLASPSSIASNQSGKITKCSLNKHSCDKLQVSKYVYISHSNSLAKYEVISSNVEPS